MSTHIIVYRKKHAIITNTINEWRWFPS